jgi:hypothetical protein
LFPDRHLAGTVLYIANENIDPKHIHQRVADCRFTRVAPDPGLRGLFGPEPPGTTGTIREKPASRRYHARTLGLHRGSIPSTLAICVGELAANLCLLQLRQQRPGRAALRQELDG